MHSASPTMMATEALGRAGEPTVSAWIAVAVRVQRCLSEALLCGCRSRTAS
jgi:hypothetical protein